MFVQGGSIVNRLIGYLGKLHYADGNDLLEHCASLAHAVTISQHALQDASCPI